MRQLSGLAHEYMAMGVLGPIQLIGRRRGEYPRVQDTVKEEAFGTKHRRHEAESGETNLGLRRSCSSGETSLREEALLGKGL